MSRVSSLANLTPFETYNSFLGVANFGKLTSVERGSGECSQSHSINQNVIVPIIRLYLRLYLQIVNDLKGIKLKMNVSGRFS